MTRPSFPTLIDRYMIVSMAPPMAAAFAVVLISLLLYRILQIFNLLAASGAQFELVARLIGALLPHYLGLALPAGYFISMFIVIARMGDASEIDALLAGGVSMERLAAPFMAAAVVVVAASVILLGFLQPYGRYDYNAGLNAALGSPWNARLQPRTFLTPGGDFVLSADHSDSTGRDLRGVFVRRLDADGREQVFTAQSGRLAPTEDGQRVQLILREVRQLQERPDNAVVGSFEQLELEAPASAATELFRERGGAARELTFPELRARMTSASATPEARLQAQNEFHTRIIRSVSPLFLPLLAIPLGMAAKRGRRTGGFILAAVILLLYEYGIDMTKAVADLGQSPPLLTIWLPFVTFSTICVWIFVSSRKRPGETPLNAVVDALGEAVEAVQSLLRRRPRAA